MGFSLVATSAQATVYDWTYTGDSVVAASGGQFTVDSGLFTSISGHWGAATITGLLAPGTLWDNDNAFPLTENGVSFSVSPALTHGSTRITFYNQRGNFGWDGNFSECGCGGTFSATVHAADVPEPASAAILGAGLAGLLAAGRSRRRPAAFTAAA